MKLDEIITLLNAGYTKDEIQALEIQENKPSAEDPEDPKDPPSAPTAPDQEEPAAPASPILNGTDNADVTKYIAQLTSQVSSLTKQIQNSNLLAAQQPAQQKNTAEDILANLINPTYKGEK